MVRGTTKYGPSGNCSANLFEDTGLSAKRRESLAKYINQGLSQKTWSSYRTAEKCGEPVRKKIKSKWSYHGAKRRHYLSQIGCWQTGRSVQPQLMHRYLAGIRKQTWALALYFQVRSPLSALFISMDRYRSSTHLANFQVRSLLYRSQKNQWFALGKER